MQLTQELLSVGLSNKEADVYLATLQLGYSQVQEIAQKAGINRTTVYTHIKNLISRGLLNAVERNARVYYVAERPEKLKFIYEQQEKELKRRQEILKQIMPELESIYHLAKDRPSVRYFKHDNELEIMRNEIEELRAEEMYNIFNFERFNEFISRRHVQNILDSVAKFKVIYIARNKIVDLRIQPFMENEKFQIKYLPVDKFGFLCELLIADNKVYISRDNDSILMNDKLFSQTLSLLFHALWGIAEKI